MSACAGVNGTVSEQGRAVIGCRRLSSLAALGRPIDGPAGRDRAPLWRVADSPPVSSPSLRTVAAYRSFMIKVGNRDARDVELQSIESWAIS
jgi:hypothetical protein